MMAVVTSACACEWVSVIRHTGQSSPINRITASARLYSIWTGRSFICFSLGQAKNCETYLFQSI